MEDDRLIILIQKYVDGSCTAAEKEMVEQWYASLNEEQKAFYDNDPIRIAASMQRSLEKIMTAIAEKPVKRLTTYKWLAAAASIALLISAGAWWYLRFHKTPAPAYTEIVAPAGHITHITLDDNTAIWLNAGSRLKYQPNSREVILDGEAYFEASTDPERPFLVHTSRLTTTVLGTTFNITAYAGAPAQTVTVTQGKVQVADDKQILGILTANKQLAYTLDNNAAQLTDVTAAGAMAWKNGRLEFDNQDMADIAARLGRWYGYSFRFKNESTAHCRYTASFNNRIQLTELMKVMKAISQINYEIDTVNKIVMLEGSGCKQ